MSSPLVMEDPASTLVMLNPLRMREPGSGPTPITAQPTEATPNKSPGPKTGQPTAQLGSGQPPKRLMSRRKSGAVAPAATAPPAIKTRRSLEAPVAKPAFPPRSARAATVSPPPPELESNTSGRARAEDSACRGTKRSSESLADKDSSTTATKGATATAPAQTSGRQTKRSKGGHVHFDDDSDNSASTDPATSTQFAKHAAVLRAVPTAIEFMLTRIRNLEAEVTELKTREANVKANAQRSEQLVVEQLERFSSSIAALTELKGRVGDGAVFTALT